MPRDSASQGARIRVLVVDDQPIAQRGVTAYLLERGFEVCQPVTAVRDLAQVFMQVAPHVVVIEPATGDRGATLLAIAAFTHHHVTANVLAFMSDSSPTAVEAVLDAGCLGAVPKTASIEALVEAVEQVAAGNRHLHPRALAALLHRRHAADTVRSMRALSGRELAVLQLVAEGHSNMLIATELGISTATVKTHVAHILRKLQAEDRAHAVSRALRLGLFD